MPSFSKQAKEREEQYRIVRNEKNSLHGGGIKVPLCKRCVELHVRCPGPEVDNTGQWDFSKKCLRCEDRLDDTDCDFVSDRTRVPRYKLDKMTEEEKKAIMKPGMARGITPAQVNTTVDASEPTTQVQQSKILIPDDHDQVQAQARPDQPNLPFHPLLQVQAEQPPATTHEVPAQQTRYTNLPLAPPPVYRTEADYIAHEIRNLFREEPDTANDVLRIANIYQRPQRQAVNPYAQAAPNQASARSTYPDPMPLQLTLTTPVTRPPGFLYDGPCRRVEHDWEAEVKMYDEQRKEWRKKTREEREAAKSPETE